MMRECIRTRHALGRSVPASQETNTMRPDQLTVAVGNLDKAHTFLPCLIFRKKNISSYPARVLNHARFYCVRPHF